MTFTQNTILYEGPEAGRGQGSMMLAISPNRAHRYSSDPHPAHHHRKQ